MYSAAMLVVSVAPFVPPLDVTPSESSRKCRQEYCSSSMDHLEMLAAFKKVWVARKRSSERSLKRQEPSSASSAPASAAFLSAPRGSGPSNLAASARKKTFFATVLTYNVISSSEVKYYTNFIYMCF